MEQIKKPTLLPQQDYDQIEAILKESFRTFEYPNEIVDFMRKASSMQSRMVYMRFATQYKDNYMFKKIALREAHKAETKSAFRDTYFKELHVFTTAIADEEYLIKYLEFAIGLIKDRYIQLQTLLKNEPDEKEPNGY
jgi:hypothetical protein